MSENVQDKDTITLDENEQISIRKEKLSALREQGQAYSNQFKPKHLTNEILSAHQETDKTELESQVEEFCVAGRIMTRRIMGKASFAHVQDKNGQIQAYIQRDALPEGVYAEFKKWDLGDIIGVKGTLFKTKTGELTIRANHIELITKALRPLPEKYHGLTNLEQRYRQRYLDLITNAQAKQTFITRSKLIDAIRQFLKSHDFLEVETPMMQVIPGGATARPFITHHNSLSMDMYLRVSPELYLKRLVVGGFERVFEINRSFRNEGLSTRHNPEFTMLEYYQAYADFDDAMSLLETLIRTVTVEAIGSLQVTYQGEEFDLSKPFKRLSVIDSILEYNQDLTRDQLNDEKQIIEIAKNLGISPKASWGLGKLQIEIFEKTVEDQLKQPTFITEYPAEVSPLARANDENPFITDRFELFIGGRELANGFSELNDPEDQAERFRKQVEEKEAGDDEAMFYDDDYITALEHGMPPAAGVGIGIDRLTMFLTDSASIRDVILFPHMRAHN